MTQTVPDTTSCLKETNLLAAEENFFLETLIEKKLFMMSTFRCPPRLTSSPLPPYRQSANYVMETVKKANEDIGSGFPDLTTEEYSEQENVKRNYDAIVPESGAAYRGDLPAHIKTESQDQEPFQFTGKRQSLTSEEFSPNPSTLHLYSQPSGYIQQSGFFEQECCQKEKQDFVPSDPLTWQPEHVMAWLSWMTEEHGLPQFDVRSFDQISGEALCCMSLGDLCQHMPPHSAEICVHQLLLVRRASTSRPNRSDSFRSSSKLVQDYHNSWGGNESDDTKPPLEDIYKFLAPVCTRLCKQGGGQIQLWQFLMELLGDHSNSTFIAWESTNGEFKMVDPDEVARRWGERKSKPNMNYDKMSRALRYYYDKNIMTKVHGKRYAYKFDFHGLAQSLQSGVEQDKSECNSNPSHYLPTYNESLQQGYFSYPNPASYPFIPTTSRLSASSDPVFPSLSYGNYPEAGHQQTEYNNRHSWSDTSSVTSGHCGYEPSTYEHCKSNFLLEQPHHSSYANYQNENFESLAPSRGSYWHQNSTNWHKSESGPWPCYGPTSTNYSYFEARATHSTSAMMSSDCVPHGHQHYHRSDICPQESVFYDGAQQPVQSGVIY